MKIWLHMDHGTYIKHGHRPLIYGIEFLDGVGDKLNGSQFSFIKFITPLQTPYLFKLVIAGM